MLKRIYHPKHFIYISSERQIVYDLMSHDTIAVNQKKTSVRNTFTVNQDIVAGGDCFVDIRNDGIFYPLNATLFARRVKPGEMTVLRVDTHRNQLDLTFLEIFQSLTKGMKLGGTHKREIQRIKEQHNVFTSIAGKLKIFDKRTLPNSHRTEIGCCFTHKHCHIPSSNPFCLRLNVIHTLRGRRLNRATGMPIVRQTHRDREMGIWGVFGAVPLQYSSIAGQNCADFGLKLLYFQTPVALRQAEILAGNSFRPFLSPFILHAVSPCKGAIMAQMKRETIYFDEKGKENTQSVAQSVKAAAERLGVSHVVVASTFGETAEAFSEILPKEISLTSVTYHAGWKGEDIVTLKQSMKERLEKRGVGLVMCSHALSGISRSVSKKFGGPNYPELIAATLKLFGQGVKVAVEVAVMAADAGEIPTNEDIIAVGGSGRGADAALVLRAAHQNNFFDLRIREILAMVRE